jgi:hypothetical protein
MKQAIVITTEMEELMPDTDPGDPYRPIVDDQRSLKHCPRYPEEPES